ncbi:S9 family peptidase [Kribbella sp. NPDC051620]|uniref:S9 family peptidase n=1 Tax=Kribbella sp. NPDC051620 TaxID=3364120 RepID=UPI0037BB47C4
MNSQPPISYQDYAPTEHFQPTLALSPDGRKLLYVSDRRGGFALWSADLGSGAHKQLTQPGLTVRELSWGPADVVAFTADRDGAESTRLYVVRITDSGVTGVGGLRAGSGLVQQHLSEYGGWSPDGGTIYFSSNERSLEDSDVMAFDIGSKTVRHITDSAGVLEPCAVDPSGKQILLLKQNTNSEIHSGVVDLGTGELTFPAALNATDSVSFPFAWADADGAAVYAVSNLGRDLMGILRFDLRTNSGTWVFEPEWEVEDAVLVAPGKLAVAVNVNGYSQLQLLGWGDPRVLDLPPGVCRYLTCSRGGERLAVLWETPTGPANVYVADLGTGAVSKVTDSRTSSADAAWVEPQSIAVQSFDRQVPALLYAPVTEPGQRCPVVVSIHGGPDAQERPRYSYGGFYQYLASRGVAVIAPNYRGSRGYGSAYQRLIQRDWGGDELRDIVACAEWARACDWTNADRIALFGASYGGFAVLSCLGRYPEYWCAGVDIVGPSNLVSFLKTVPPTWRAGMYRSVGHPEHDAEMLSSRSPLSFAENIRAPLHVIQGALDPRVSRQESDQLVAELERLGREVEYVVYPDEGHGVIKKENILDSFTRLSVFLDRHLFDQK